mmetsp:Transcript_1438/g.2910  ORF Transcript_1438/g.2910 Transcript_1438/m.2910 type:complete len:1474 (-) Transcript_1438:210-4631(-)|eukprot:CAMPEP_0113413690 /NCGR_PEP_ID=MMETSP0013_2-20120614/23584_1 /TAXON_ID=2843 ORGANISM="Skeletonema costatum, Strain 1716" /NCGR_SAMPLE_ID=MMETSP0013_2 /ASSEMBLY_ACC=CAM_ASM_000158 /LENGTH=1473 /DNA_ID=CAMNT_0000300429 /DNA_START=335 /DNA_END=4756 /DNA_ORIENTATION=- /assembly_acc=CAM_ASM_000158
MAGFKGRVARMLLNFLDEHGNYRESLEEAAARAAAAEANSLLARQEKRGRKKGRRSRNKKNGIDNGGGVNSEEDDDDDWEEDDELPKLAQSTIPTSPIHNGLPEDPYEQIQFYFQTFKSRTTSQLQQQLHSYQTSTVHWIHGELHHDEHVSTTSLIILVVTLISFIGRRRAKTYGMWKRIHAILGKKFEWRSYLHSNFIRGVVLYQLASESIPILEKLRMKASKAEEVALQSMRPYQRKKYQRYNMLEVWGERVVMSVLMMGMVLSGMTFCMSLYNLMVGSGMVITVGGFSIGPFGGVEEIMKGGEDAMMLTDGYIYSLDGETDFDGYPLHLREVAEQRYAECIVDAEVGGNDPTELCDLNVFFGDAAAISSNDGSGGDEDNVPNSVLRTKINVLLNQIGIPSVLSTYLTTLPNQTLAYLSSLFTLCLFVLSHYISHKIHMAAMSNDPMKHFVVVDKTVKADGTVEAKKGETEAQRKKRERMLQAERYKAQMAQLAYEAKTKAQARIARLEGKEAAKREEEEKEKKVVEEQDETVKMYGRQFMMIKAGVPEGAILNSLLPMGIEGEEAKEILTKLHEIKERRSAEEKKAAEEEAKKAEEEKREDEMKDRIAADRLKKLKSGKIPRGPPSMGLPPSSTANAARKGKMSLPPKLPKPVEKAGAVKTEEASSRTGIDRATGVKVVQPWASPSKKEKRGAKNKRWDKVTKSWVDRDLETDGADAVPTSVVLKKEGEKEDTEQDFKVFVPTPKVAETKPQRQTAVDPAALRTSMMSQIRKKSPPPDQSKLNSGPRCISVEKKDSAENTKTFATANDVKVVEQKYDAKNFNPVSPRNNTEKSEETKVTSRASSQSSSPPPVLLRVTESPVDDVFAPQAFDGASPWARRSSTRDIKAMIEAVEAAPEDQVEELFLGPNNVHTPAFENAMRASNSSWDKRPSSSDIMAKIRAAEQQGASAEDDKALRRLTSKPPKGRMIRIDEGKNMTKQMRSKDEIDCKIGTSLLQKTRSQGGINSDDEISEISMVDELSVTSATFVSTPKQLKKSAVRVTENELHKTPKLDEVDKSNVAKTKDEASEAGTDVTGKNSASKSEPKEETEEEKLRKKKADERAKKFEAMNARRRKGKGDDDGTAVSGISRRQRIRRKRSALAAITPEEKKRDDWKKGIFASVLNVEQKQWKKSIFAHVINAEETRAANIKAQEDLEELNAAARRRMENQKRLDAKARKFAARAEKFHKLRRSGDGGSVVSSASRMRRRRTRKVGLDTPPRQSAAPSSETAAAPQCQTDSIVEEGTAGVSQGSAPKQQEADDAKNTGVAMELVLFKAAYLAAKENEIDVIADAEQKDASTAESPDQRKDETNDKRDNVLEENDEDKHVSEEVSTLVNSENIEQLPADKKNEGDVDSQLDRSDVPGPSCDEVVDQSGSEKGVEITLISAINSEEEKTEPEESKVSLLKTPISPIKKMKNRRRAAAMKKKNGST